MCSLCVVEVVAVCCVVGVVLLRQWLVCGCCGWGYAVIVADELLLGGDSGDNWCVVVIIKW